MITAQDRETAYAKAPQPIKDALSDGPLFDFFDSLRSTYKIHVDIVGKIIELVRDLLLGLINPAQFFQSLQQAGVPYPQAQQIVSDLNTNIFTPLHNKMMESDSAAPDLEIKSDSLTQVVPTQPVMSAVKPAPTIPTPTTPSTPILSTPISAPTPVAPRVAPAPIAPAPAPAKVINRIQITPKAPVPIATPVSTSTPMPAPRTMMSDMKEVKEHPENIHAPEAVAPYVPTPKPQPVSPQMPAQTPRPTPQSQNKEDLHNVLKSYGVDPYREPAE